MDLWAWLVSDQFFPELNKVQYKNNGLCSSLKLPPQILIFLIPEIWFKIRLFIPEIAEKITTRIKNRTSKSVTYFTLLFKVDTKKILLETFFAFVFLITEENNERWVGGEDGGLTDDGVCVCV